MLVLTRRIGEEIVLPGVGVRFTLLSVGPGRVRVGVVAPREVAVLRAELEPPAAPTEPQAPFPIPVSGATK